MSEVEQLKEQLKQAQAACAEMRNKISKCQERLNMAAGLCKNCNGSGRDHDGEAWLDVSCPDCQIFYDALCDLNIPSSSGKGWHSPEEWDALEARLMKVEQEEVRRIKHLNRLATWAQQDPTGPLPEWMGSRVQEWVMNELKAALGSEWQETGWEPDIVQLRENVEKIQRYRVQLTEQRDKLLAVCAAYEELISHSSHDPGWKDGDVKIIRSALAAARGKGEA